MVATPQFVGPLIVATALSVAGTSPAWAQGSDLRLLLDRVERIQRELSTLQRHVYRGGRPPVEAVPAPAPAGPAGVEPSVAARLHVRITELEGEIRQITGRIEELQHANRQLTRRLDKLVGDVDVRLSALEKAAKAGPAAAAAAPPQEKSGAPVLSPRPGVLADVPARPAGAGSKPPAAKAGGLPADATPAQRYNHAIKLVRTEKFTAAEHALRAFIDAHPKDGLVPNAYYWLGETYYARKDYQRAAFTFAEGFQKFPDDAKAPDSLLKLGMALGRLGKKKEACTTFARLEENYPRANATVKTRTAQQRRANGCS